MANLGIAAGVGLVFCVGAADSLSAGHVDREDLLLWLPLIAGIVCVLGGAWWLKARGLLRAANGILLLMAVPGLVAALGLLTLLATLMRAGAWR